MDLLNSGNMYVLSRQKDNNRDIKHRSVYHSEFRNKAKFHIRIRCILVKISDPKLANFYKQNICQRTTHIGQWNMANTFLCKFGKFGAQYFQEFATDSYETLHIY